MRSELIEMEEVGIYNEWVTELRKKVLGGELGGDRKELWRDIAKNKVGLVEAKEVEIGGMNEDVARKVSFPFAPCSSFFCLISSFLHHIGVYRTSKRPRLTNSRAAMKFLSTR